MLSNFEGENEYLKVFEYINKHKIQNVWSTDLSKQWEHCYFRKPVDRNQCGLLFARQLFQHELE